MTRRWVPTLLALALGGSLLALPGSASAIVSYTLSVSRSGNGGGSVTSDVQPGIDCGSTCSADFLSGTVVTLTANADSSSTFMGWNGDCSGTGTCQVTMDAAHSVGAVFSLSYRPDEWIKLCGMSTGCTIDPLPHPWHGNDVYNTTGKRQSLDIKMEEGEGVRYWITLQNDGALGDTIVVQGCKGNSQFVVNRVVLGEWKRPSAAATKVTSKFLDGSLQFSFPPASQNKKVVFTLNIIARTAVLGASYRCPITIHSKSKPALQDTVSARMTTI